MARKPGRVCDPGSFLAKAFVHAPTRFAETRPLLANRRVGVQANRLGSRRLGVFRVREPK
jgi:hypothetical protein